MVPASPPNFPPRPLTAYAMAAKGGARAAVDAAWSDILKPGLSREERQAILMNSKKRSVLKEERFYQGNPKMAPAQLMVGLADQIKRVAEMEGGVLIVPGDDAFLQKRKDGIDRALIKWGWRRQWVSASRGRIRRSRLGRWCVM